MLVTLLGMALIALANGLLTNALYGAPKGVYLFVGKTHPTSGVTGQTLTAVRGYSAANIRQGGWFSADPCNADLNAICVGVQFVVTGVSVVPFDLDPRSVVVEIDGRAIASGGEVSQAGLPHSAIDGPIRVSRGDTAMLTARVAIPHAPDGRKRPAVVRITDLDAGASWRYDMPVW